MDELVQIASVVSTVLALIGIGLMTILHLVLAQAVANDVDRLRTAGRDSRFFGAVGWAFTTVLMGLFALAFYWVVHHSNLRDPASDRRLPGH